LWRAANDDRSSSSAIDIVAGGTVNFLRRFRRRRFNLCWLRQLLFDASLSAVPSMKDRYDRHLSNAAWSMEAATVPK
jgi:hypothetical protein